MPISSTQKATDDLKAIAPEFAKLTQEFLFDDIWNRPGLSQRDKSLITVTCLVALNCIEQVEFHLKKAFENGLTREELGRHYPYRILCRMANCRLRVQSPEKSA